MSNQNDISGSATYPPKVIKEIHRAASEGIYSIRGAGAKRRVPHFDDLVFLGASMSRYPLEGYRERCDTNVTIGARFASQPVELAIPITIAGMSFGALGANAKRALGLGATAMGTSTTTGDGGMTPEEREASKTLVYQYLPSRYGMTPDQLRQADAIEVVVGQGAKPGGGGMLLGQKITDRVAAMRTLPAGIDQRSACRHPDWTGPDDLEIKIQELREITNWEKPIYVKVGATRTRYDVMLAAGASDAKVLLLAVDDPDQSVRTAELVRERFPNLTVIARAKDRQHAYRLMEQGVTHVIRETFHSGIEAGRITLENIGFSGKDAKHIAGLFRDHDERRLRHQFGHHTDEKAFAESAKAWAEELEEIFAQDALDDKPEEGEAKYHLLRAQGRLLDRHDAHLRCRRLCASLPADAGRTALPVPVSK